VRRYVRKEPGESLSSSVAKLASQTDFFSHEYFFKVPWPQRRLNDHNPRLELRRWPPIQHRSNFEDKFNDVEKICETSISARSDMLAYVRVYRVHSPGLQASLPFVVASFKSPPADRRMAKLVWRE
jgi:hypothetical protein